MKDFDARWQKCAAHARQAPARDEHAPLGLANRVVARTSAPGMPAWDLAWERLMVRVLAGALALLAVAAMSEVPHLRDTRPLESGVENTVAQLVWSL